jgi:hypothetical protein
MSKKSTTSDINHKQCLLFFYHNDGVGRNQQVVWLEEKYAHPGKKLMITDKKGMVSGEWELVAVLKSGGFTFKDTLTDCYESL